MDLKTIKIVNRDVLKYFAVIVMFIGHFVTYTLKLKLPIPRIGIKMSYMFMFMAPPIFMFFIAEGYRYTRNKRSYALRLFIFALVTQIPYVLCFDQAPNISTFFTSWNVIATFFVSFLILFIGDFKLPVYVRVLLMVLCLGLTYILQMEWMVFGPLAIMIFYYFKQKPILRFVLFELLMLVQNFISIGCFFIDCKFIVPTTASNIIITFLYNGKKGSDSKFNKYFFYVFYPVHLLIIYLFIILYRR